MSSQTTNERREKRRFIIGSIMTPILLVIGALFGTYIIAPWQDQNVENARRQRYENEPPLRVRIREILPEPVTYVFDQPLSMESKRALQTERLWEGILAKATPFDSQCIEDSIDPSLKKSVCQKHEGRTHHEVTLIGRRQEAVRIVDIRAQLIDTHTPPTAAIVFGPTGGGGDIREGGIPLGSSDLRLRDPDTSQHYFDEKFVYVSENEPEVFFVDTSSSTYDFLWEIVIDLMVEGEKENMVVRADGSTQVNGKIFGPDGTLLRTDGKLTGTPFRNPGPIQPVSAYKSAFSCEVGEACKPTLKED
ncbi:hypothetical protein [Nonomuraea sp. NPDC049695]|uniref:hypothetical protein n=1 Tax=Nonomuraea sp. NPDC049695 TaxID=3154734 RepID=UPI003422DF7C